MSMANYTDDPWLDEKNRNEYEAWLEEQEREWKDERIVDDGPENVADDEGAGADTCAIEHATELR